MTKRISLSRVSLQAFSYKTLDLKPHLCFSGSILEVGAFYSLAIKDVKAFERYEAMLTVYYRDLR